MNVENVRREDWIVGGLALLLAIFLLVLPFWEASATYLGVTISASSPATGDPEGWLGVLAVIVCLAIVADLAVERFSPQTQVPVLNTRAHTRFVLAVVVAAFILLKLVFELSHLGNLGWGFFLELITVAALVYVALQIRNGAPLPGAGAGGRGVGGPSTGGGVGGAPAGGSGASGVGGSGVGGAPVGAPPVGAPPAGTPPVGGPPAGGPGLGGPGGPPTTPGV